MTRKESRELCDADGNVKWKSESHRRRYYEIEPDQIPEDQIVEFYRDQISECDSLSSECVDDILTYATRLEARVKELEAANAWQPIETAPRDGSRILAYQSSTGDCISECWWEEDLTDFWAGWVNDFDSEPSPTHWRPLPSPPEAE